MLKLGDVIKINRTIEYTSNKKDNDYLSVISNKSVCIFIKYKSPYNDEITILWKNKLCFTPQANEFFFTKI